MSLPNPNTLLPASVVASNRLIIEAGRKQIFAPNPQGGCGTTADVIVFGNASTCIFWQKTAVAPNYKAILQAIMVLQRYIDYGKEVMNYNPENLPYRTHTGADGITRKWIIEANVSLCPGYGGASYNGRSWNALTQSSFANLINTVNDASPTVEQVFFYELGRSLYDNSLDNILDWQLGLPSEYGFWTLGFNGAMTVLAPEHLGLKMNYFGQNTAMFRAARKKDLDTYIRNPQYTFENTWSKYLLPWNTRQSVNDLMSGLLIYIADETGFGFGGIQRVFYLLKQQPTTPSKADRQARATNLYRAVYQTALDLHDQAKADAMYTYFNRTLRWTFITK